MTNHPDAQMEQWHEKLGNLSSCLNNTIKDKEEAVELLLIALTAGGHVLLEDVPGVGKTTIAKALSKSISSDFNRIQFTPDLLPSDISGSLIFNPKTGEFNFRKGPVFCNILLADEINRASPRTQSALLEAMSEFQVTVSGENHKLEAPFLVIATQNPVEYHGTYPLPEAQLDRFAIKMSLDYPHEEAELKMLFDQQTKSPLDDISPVLTSAEIVEIQNAVRMVEVEESVARYMLDIIKQTRDHFDLSLGASPRASLILYRCAQARALISKRKMVIPDDIKALSVEVLSHRLALHTKAKHSGVSREEIVKEILEKVKVPL